MNISAQSCKTWVNCWGSVIVKYINWLKVLNYIINHQICQVQERYTTPGEEAIVNVMVTAQTMTDINGNTVYALPHDRMQEVLRKFNRLSEQYTT